MVVLRLTLIAVLAAALIIFSGFTVIYSHPTAQQPEQSTVTFNYTNPTHTPWTVRIGGENYRATGNQTVIHLAPGKYRYEVESSVLGPVQSGYVKLSSAPWWVSVVGIAVGGLAGSLVTGGNPIGVIGGAITGDLIANYLYNLLTGEQQSLQANYVPYAENVFNETVQSISQSEAYANTMATLVDADYYYFAQLMEAIAPDFLNQTSLNATHIFYDSGAYATMDKLAGLVLYSINDLLQSVFTWIQAENQSGVLGSYANLVSGAGTEYQDTQGYIGFELKAGNEIYVQNQTSYLEFVNRNPSVNLTNVLTGKTYTETAPQITTTYQPSSWAGGSGANQNTGITELRGIPSGLYSLTSIGGQGLAAVYSDSPPIMADGIPAATLSTTMGVATWDNSGSGVNSGFTYGAPLTVTVRGGSQQTQFTEGKVAIAGTSLYNVTVQGVPENFGFAPQYLNQFVINLNQTFNNAYASAQVYFNQLRDLGYTNASQLPPGQIVPLPSFAIPPQLVDQSLNLSQITALYDAYLEDIKAFYANHTKLTFNTTMLNETFQNGFYEEYGNLTMPNGTGPKIYVNNTDFLFMTQSPKEHFYVKKTSYFNTSGFEALVISDPVQYNIGSLIEIPSGSTFFTEAIYLNGSKTGSAYIYPAPISVVLPPSLNLTTIKGGSSPPVAWYSQLLGGLPAWAWALFGVLAIIIVAAAERKRK